MTTPKLHPDLSAFLLCLAAHRVRFVVLGGHVLATLGRPRYTDDLDVLIEPTRANAARLADALAEFGYEALGRKAEAHFSKPERMATLGRPPVAIDILSSTPGIDFREAWAGRQILSIDGRDIGFLGLAEFVKTKRACGRTKDLLDLELLREAGLLPPSAELKHRPQRRPKTSVSPGASRSGRPSAKRTSKRGQR
jgi:hypothetical protein